MSTPPVMSADELQSRIDAAWISPADQLVESAVSSEGRALVQAFMATGDAHYEALAQNELSPDDLLHHRLITFAWPDGAKRFMLLWRGILLELERAHVLRMEGDCDTAEIEVLAKAGKEKLAAAAAHWLDEFAALKGRLQSDSVAAREQLYTWNLQLNPWPTFRKQLEAIGSQLANMHADFKVRINAAETLVKLSKQIATQQAGYAGDLQEISSAAQSALAIIKEAENAEPAKVSTSKLSALDPSDRMSGSMDEVSRSTSELIEKLPERIMLYVGTPSGKLQFREVNLERQTAQWLSAEVLPGLNQQARIGEQTLADLMRTLVDVRNRVLLARDQDKAVLAENQPDKAIELGYLESPLEALLERIARAEKEQAEIAQRNLAKVSDELRLSRGYDPALSFLQVSFEAGMSQVRRTQDALLNRFGAWLLRQRDKALNLRSRVEEEERLSTGERIVRAIRSRRLDPKNAN